MRDEEVRAEEVEQEKMTKTKQEMGEKKRILEGRRSERRQ